MQMFRVKHIYTNSCPYANIVHIILILRIQIKIKIINDGKHFMKHGL